MKVKLSGNHSAMIDCLERELRSSGHEVERLYGGRSPFRSPVLETPNGTRYSGFDSIISQFLTPSDDHRFFDF